MSFANNVDWGWDLPPGCTQREIDRASGFETDGSEDGELDPWCSGPLNSDGCCSYCDDDLELEDDGEEERRKENKAIFYRESEEE